MSILLWILASLVAVWAVASVLTKLAVRRGARRVLEDNEALFGGTHSYVEVDARRFRWLDREFYDDLQKLLEREGFTRVADIENVTLTAQMPHMRTFLRCMLDHDGSVMAGFYHVVLRGWQRVFQWIGLIPRRIQTLDLETELADGTWVVTSNIEGLDTTQDQPEVIWQRLPQDTPYPEVLRAHREQVARVLAETGLEPRRHADLADMLAAADRLQALRNEVLHGRDALVRTIEAQPGDDEAKRLLIEEVQRS